MELEKIKMGLRPDKSTRSVVTDFVSRINREIEKASVNAVCQPGGSVAKGTHLKDDFDVDLFVKFDYSYKDKDISAILKDILKPFNPIVLHGSRDYYQVRGELNFEIVPVLDIVDPTKALNVTDMSHLHVEWVKKRLKPGQEDEIRLAKKFCKAQGVYGAESYIKGFSGHVIDILIIHYGTFRDLLKGSLAWKPKVIIDVQKHFKSKRDILFELNQSKIEGPMVIIDPILKTRNAASALSYEKFALFKKRAGAFIKKPSESFFIEPEINKAYLKKKHKNIVIVEARPPEGKEDVVGSKLLKAFKFLRASLTKKGFSIKESGWAWKKPKKSLFFFALKEEELPKVMEVAGPPLDMKEACTNFRKKYRDVKTKGKKLVALVKVEKRGASEITEALCRDSYLKDKVMKPVVF